VGLVMAKPEFDVTPRPSLRKAGDSSVHPVSETKSSEPKRMGPDATGFGNASDSVTRPRREKLVEVSIAIPKSLRKKLKSDAKAKGISVNELIALRLNEY
jgi:hypothetical protein